LAQKEWKMTSPVSSTDLAVGALVVCIARTLHQSDPTFPRRLQQTVGSMAEKMKARPAEYRLLSQVQAALASEDFSS
jgi:hypothetical protein